MNPALPPSYTCLFLLLLCQQFVSQRPQSCDHFLFQPGSMASTPSGDLMRMKVKGQMRSLLKPLPQSALYVALRVALVRDNEMLVQNKGSGSESRK